MWPDAPEVLSDLFVESAVAADDIAKITHLNAMKWYNFDPFAHVPADRATVGSLRSQAAGHDVSIRAMSDREKLSPEAVQARWQNMGSGAAGTGAQAVSE